jgi:hypothetical protein
MVQDGARQPVVLGKEHGVFHCVGRGYLGAFVFQCHGNVHGDQRFVLDYEER